MHLGATRATTILLESLKDHPKSCPIIATVKKMEEDPNLLVYSGQVCELNLAAQGNNMFMDRFVDEYRRWPR